MSDLLRRFASRRAIPLTLLGLAVVVVVLLLLLPAEQTLGNVIKLVFFHGALVQVGLLAFAVAGLLGLAYLLRRSDALYGWLVAAQQAALLIWVLYVLSSMLVTYLAWGVAIAWTEPRVRVTAEILAAAVGFGLLAGWVGQRVFTALTNMAMGVLAWALVKGAALLQHPLNPIGASSSAAYRWLFPVLLVAVLLMALQTIRWLRARSGRETSATE